MRYANKNNVVNDLLANQAYSFPTSVPKVNRAILATRLKKDEVAITYIHEDNTYGDFVRIRVIDVNTMTMVYSQEFQVEDKSEIIDQTYDSINDILTILYPYQGTTTSFIQIQPHATSTYTAPYFFHNNYLFSSLDALGGSTMSLSVAPNGTTNTRWRH